MRISDWSSDVCSSDLTLSASRRGVSAAKSLDAPWPHRLAAGVLIAKFMSLEGTLFASLVDGRTPVLTLCDAHPHDNPVAQLHSRNGARTLTVHPGQYRVITPVNLSDDDERSKTTQGG